MASYVVTGSNRGIGFEFLRQLSENPASIVIGLSRNKKATEEKVKAEIGRSNIHILEADASDAAALKKAAEDTSKITGGKIDYVIANAAVASEWSEYNNIGTLGQEPERLEKDILDTIKINAIGPIHLFNFFLPLLRNGSAKKAIAISTGMADAEMISKFGVDISPPYAISKGALNVAVAKFDAQYRKEGILFVAISPGLVDTGKGASLTEEQKIGLGQMVAKFSEYAPNWTGAITPEVSVKAVLKVIDESSIENGTGGAFISHWGNKQWL
ncbi:unnamed protein product [Clonostachys rosea]|uniref:NAD(P)-binding protein n=1 Tax=Bionectria ochroleuca TaxID=29856 RepID=A0ABY6V0Q1_BIOOC|nr:unnamed protein product [Clonostachys rosea]